MRDFINDIFLIFVFAGIHPDYSSYYSKVFFVGFSEMKHKYKVEIIAWIEDYTSKYEFLNYISANE